MRPGTTTRTSPGRENARRADAENDDATVGVVDDVGVDAGVRDEASGQPREQGLAALRLLLVGIEGRPDDGAGGVVDAEQQLAAVLAVQGSFVGERGEILAEFFRSDVVALPLAPFGLGRQRAQAVDELDRRTSGHA
jgi:hypothetical protein